MALLKSLGLLINLKTLVVALLSILSTYICYIYGFYADLPLTLIGIAIVFPVVFSINSAYKRRETGLYQYAQLKAHGRTLFFAVRDWVPGSTKKFQNRFKFLLYDLLVHCRIMFNTDHTDDDFREKQIYTNFSQISKFLEQCRKKGVSTSEISRMNQYFGKMLIAFENMKHIYQYRTPVTLRAYSTFFIYLLPIIYGPYFAYMAQIFPDLLIYLMPVLLTVILVSLDNIQEQLENPFDLVGEDDIKLNVEKYINRLDLE